MLGQYAFMCKCGGLWAVVDKDGRVFHDDKKHFAELKKLPGGAWRGHPADVKPLRQWMRENLPGSRIDDKGFAVTAAGDDGFLRLYTVDHPVGIVAQVEGKTNGAPIDVPTKKSWQAISGGKTGPGILIQMSGGNVPTPLKHYPLTHDIGVPEPEVTATHVWINGWLVDGDMVSREIVNMLCACFTDHYGPSPAIEKARSAEIEVEGW